MLVNTEVFLNAFNMGVAVIIPLRNSEFNSKIPQCSFRHTTRTRRQAHRHMAYLKHLKITYKMTPLLCVLLRYEQHRKTSSCFSVCFSSGVKIVGAGRQCPLRMIASIDRSGSLFLGALLKEPTSLVC